jgi:hypothetical protein
MIQKLMAIFAEELLNIRKRAEQTALNIEQIKDNLDSERQELRRLVEGYNVKRVELFLKELSGRKLTWCTRCKKALSENETEFILREGRTTYTHGYGNSYYGFRDFSKLHRVCAACRDESFNRHGWVSGYDTQAKNQEKFYAFRVEKHEDGYYACKFGNWVKLEDKKYELPGPPSELIENLAKEWNLPPRMEVKFQNDDLMVHEQVLTPVQEQTTATELA